MTEKKTRTLTQDLAVIRRVIGMAKRLNPWAIYSAVILYALESLIPMLNIIFPAMIINELVGTKNQDRLLWLVITTIGINFMAQLIRRAMVRVRVFQRDSFGMKSMLEMAKSTVNMEYEHAEDPGIQQRRQKIQESWRYFGDMSSLVSRTCMFGQGLLTVIISVGIIAQILLLPTTGGYMGLLGFIDSQLAAVTLLALVAAMTLFSLRNTNLINRYGNEQLVETMEWEKTFHYLLFNTISDYRLGQDIRLYGMDKLFGEQLDHYLANSTYSRGTYQARVRKILAANQLGSSLITASIYCFVALKAALGSVPIGNVLLYIGAISQFNSGCTTMISHYATLRYKCELDQEALDYLDLPKLTYRGTLPVEKRDDQRFEFEVRNLSFKYPGSEEYVLRNVNLKIVIGERMAIVGMNGSGKTTLIKLLCRLYDPTEGEILLNGIDISKYDLDEYWTVFSVVFQDFRLFSLPLGQNVAASVNYDTAKVTSDLEQAGFGDRLERMHMGLDTPLYKHLDDNGVEISGGEAQKVAIARALYKDAPFIILDEPTAALDPLSEAEIYGRFNDLVGNKTAIYISHRLSSCRFCQDIVVFHEGAIVQRGSHDALLTDASGKYAEMWNAQAQYYQEDEAPTSIPLLRESYA